MRQLDEWRRGIARHSLGAVTLYALGGLAEAICRHAASGPCRRARHLVQERASPWPSANRGEIAMILALLVVLVGLSWLIVRGGDEARRG